MGATGSAEETKAAPQAAAPAAAAPASASPTPAPAAATPAAAVVKEETPAHHALVDFTIGLRQSASIPYMKKLYAKFPEYAAHPVTKGKKNKKEKGEGKGKKEGKGKDGKGKGKGKDAKGTTTSGSGPYGGGSGYRLNVKNLAKEVTEVELKALFEPFGTVSIAQVKKDDDGASRGFGFVVMSTEDEGKKAIAEMNDKEMNGKKLAVGAAERREGTEEMGKGKGKGGKGMDLQMQQQQMYMQQMAYMQQYAYMSQYYAMAQQQQAQATMGGEFEGSIKSVTTNRSHGFIVCAQTWSQFERDVYVDSALLPEGAGRGTRVKFTVERNEKGHPKAKTCKLVG